MVNVSQRNNVVHIDAIQIPVSIFDEVYNMYMKANNRKTPHIEYCGYSLDVIGNNIYMTDGQSKVKMTANQLESISQDVIIRG